MRINYWSNSKLADWIRGAEKPKAAEMSDWALWERTAKRLFPIRYWIAEDVLNSIQNIIHFPADQLHSFVYWINRRFIDQSHIIRTGLKKGGWHETDEKMLHGMFEELVSFVEGQKAHMSWHGIREDLPANDHFVPWTEKNWFTRNLTNWKSQHYGVQHLLWEIGLKYDESWGADKNDPKYGQTTTQAEAALEQLDLYVWWKFIRPMRQDPMDESGYTEYFENMREKYGEDYMWTSKTTEDDERQRTCSEACDKIEKFYDTVDTENLIRLIKIRKTLWT